MDVAFTNSYIVYNMMNPNELTLLDFKTIVSNYLIGRYISQSIALTKGKKMSQKKVSVSV